MKKLLSLIAITLLAGLTFAQNSATVTQGAGTVINPVTNNLNDAFIDQVGHQLAEINQNATDEWNYLDLDQATGTGYRYTARVDQQAKLHNEAIIFQATSGGPGIIDLDQTSANSYNFGHITYSAGWIYDANVDIDQVGDGRNYAYTNVNGAASYVRIGVNQSAVAGQNYININAQHYNKVGKANADGTFDLASQALQVSSAGDNELIANISSLEFGLNQNGGLFNYANVTASGSPISTLAVYQDASGSNTLNALMTGGNNNAQVIQTNPGGNNVASVTQN